MAGKPRAGLLSFVDWLSGMGVYPFLCGYFLFFNLPNC